MDAFRVKQAYKDYFLSMPGVVGLGLGSYHDVSDCLNVYTSEPVRLPREVEGVPVVPFRSGLLRHFAVGYPLERYQQLMRPFPAGVSIGSMGYLGPVSGTLGFVVPDRDGYPLLLGNNHVLCGLDTVELGGAEEGQPVWQPGSEFSEVVASLLRWVPISLQAPNQLDCALAAPLNPDVVNPTVLGVGQPGFIAQPSRGSFVAKVGMATGLTIGKVIDTSATLRISYGPIEATFEDQVVIDNFNYSFAKPGDSGAGVMAMVNGKLAAVGLLLGGSDQVVIANRMSLVQQALGFSMPVRNAMASLTSIGVSTLAAVLAPILL